MQIVIPMSGFGERFRRSGTTIPKPLIEIDNKPMIAHVIDMFPGESNFLFICSNDHLANTSYNMEHTIQKYCPTGRVVGIPLHKLGPVHAIHQVEHLIDSQEPVVVNYCDFSCFWDWNHFKNFVASIECQGAIPAYKGLHPHSLGTTNYAYMRESSGWLLDIKEKEPFTENRMEEYASSGTYYFSTGKIMKDAFLMTINQDLNVDGEYYVSLAYKTLLAANHPIAIYPLQHFMQWGTPEDVAEYRVWSTAFRRLTLSKQTLSKSQGSLIIPMSGLGQRFSSEGYTTPKPLIPVSGRPMVLQATRDLPPALHHAFVLRRDMPGFSTISQQLLQTYPNAILETVPTVTDGQACTALIGLEALKRDLGYVTGPITFGACDNGMLYDTNVLQHLIDDAEIDVIIWGVRGHPAAIRHPDMYGWIDEKSSLIRRISVKEPLKTPEDDPIVLGTFTFRRAIDFQNSIERLFARDGRTNDEFYIDSCINDAIELGLRCYLFEVDNFFCWGTPNELGTFEYWQSCFHKWSSHPYRLEYDERVELNNIGSLNNRYRPTVPSQPGLRY